MDATSYTVIREIPFSAEKIYQAWTDEQQIPQWYGPVGMNTKEGSVSSDARVGGNWSATVVDPQGGQHQFTGEYHEVVPNQKLVYTLDYSNPDMPNMPKYPDGVHEVVTLTIEDKGASSVLTFTQNGFLPAAQIPYAQAGMESYFDSLVNFLSA
jgi:uncharacterized protein YndB with AHSA1/START domain